MTLDDRFDLQMDHYWLYTVGFLVPSEIGTCDIAEPNSFSCTIHQIFLVMIQQTFLLALRVSQSKQRRTEACEIKSLAEQTVQSQLMLGSFRLTVNESEAMLQWAEASYSRITEVKNNFYPVLK
jgi:hypothetical protein